MMLHTKYQSSRPYGSREEDFLSFSYISLCKTNKPQGRGYFRSVGNDLNNLGRGPQDDASYQISKL